MIYKPKGVKEHRDIKITSKRQLTIPKSFFDALHIEEEVQAYLLDDGIFLKPIRKESVYEQDIQSIVHKALEEGLTGDDLAKEIAHRISRYEQVLGDRIQEFKQDMNNENASGDDEEDIDFNGLDVFFDKKDGEASESN